jgi:hypothetical protein
MFILALLLVLGLPRAALAAEGPLELAGIRLGESVDAFKDKLLTDKVDKAFLRPYLGIMPMVPVPGYRSGYVDFGQCAKPGRIVRIKMNYVDDSLTFFNRILEALKKRYGEPAQWRGNAFGTLRTWKWSLTAPGGQHVSLILMHYEGEDGAFTEGNSIRIAATDMVREEEHCHAVQSETAKGRSDAKKEGADLKALGLDWFLPR